MTHRHVGTEGWLKCHPFFLAFALAACTHAPPRAPVTPVAVPTACPSTSIGSSTRFTAEAIDTGLPARGQWRDGFELADMNGDGHVDLLHGPPRKGNFQPVIFLGDGNARFARWMTAHFPPLPYDYGDVAAADVNGDGAMDIALAAHLRGLTVLIHEANGHYAPWAEGLEIVEPGRSEAVPFTSRAIAVADWNLDGRPDLLALNEGPARLALAAGARPPQSDALAIYLNRAGFWDRIEEPELRFFGSSIAVGDVNGDRRPDALLGTDLAGAMRLLIIGQRESWSATPLGTLPENAAVTATALHDVNGDRRDELFYATRFGLEGARCTTLELARYAAAGDATRLWSEAGLDPIVAIAFADLDGNLKDDLVALRRGGTLLLFAADGEGFTRDAVVSPPEGFAGCDAYDLHAADLDADGRIELIASFAGDVSPARRGCRSGGGFAAWRVNSAR